MRDMVVRLFSIPVAVVLQAGRIIHLAWSASRTHHIGMEDPHGNHPLRAAYGKEIYLEYDTPRLKLPIGPSPAVFTLHSLPLYQLQPHVAPSTLLQLSSFFAVRFLGL